MVSSVIRFVFGLSSIALLTPVSHARSFPRDLAVPPQLQGTWTYQGCYIDVGRTLTEGGYDDIIGMTDESCIAYCDGLGYNYAGTGEASFTESTTPQFPKNLGSHILSQVLT